MSMPKITKSLILKKFWHEAPLILIEIKEELDVLKVK